MRKWQNKVRHGSCLFLLLASVVLGGGGCSLSSNNQELVQLPDMHNSRDALDWGGTYTGVLPCADCSGIQTTLTLSPAHTYVLKSTYLGVEVPDPEYIDQGVFVWDDAGSTVELLELPDRSGLFQVGENRLFALDQTGKRVEGVLASAYVLERVRGIEEQDVNAAVDLLADIPWELVELDGVALSTTQIGVAWLVFKRESQRVYGSAGCNRLTGSWVAGDDAMAQQGAQDAHAGVPLPLHLGPLGATMMACPAELMQLEDSFLSALATVTGVYLDGEGLILTDSSGHKVARFAARNAQ